ncbi:MAG: hypothetical protein ACRYFS_15245 [Janthinobacterium lividum]
MSYLTNTEYLTSTLEDRYRLTITGYAALERAHAESGCYPGPDWQPEDDERILFDADEEDARREWEAVEEQRNFFGFDVEGGHA